MRVQLLISTGKLKTYSPHEFLCCPKKNLKKRTFSAQKCSLLCNKTCTCKKQSNQSLNIENSVIFFSQGRARSLHTVILGLCYKTMEQMNSSDSVRQTGQHD